MKKASKSKAEGDGLAIVMADSVSVVRRGALKWVRRPRSGKARTRLSEDIAAFIANAPTASLDQIVEHIAIPRTEVIRVLNEHYQRVATKGGRK